MSEIKIEAKYCGKCKTVKHVNDFYKCEGRNYLGLTSNCKECFNEYTKTYRAKKSEKSRLEREQRKKEKEELKALNPPKKRGRPKKIVPIPENIEIKN